MQCWNGEGVFQWEHMRKWDLATLTSEIVRAEGAVVMPGGLTSWSVFFRRQSQSAGTFDLFLYTTPIFFKPLDEDITQAITQYALLLALDPAGALTMTGTAAKIFGGKLKSDQPMGTLLFYEMKNQGGAQANIVGDIYLVPNHAGMLSQPRIAKTVDAGQRPAAASMGGQSMRMR
jgi:hypothetical protein